MKLLENRAIDSSRQCNIISFISAGTFSSGNGGAVEISTNQLLITDGGTVASTTGGIGEGGNIVVHADNIDIIGINPTRFAPSTVAASSFSAGSAGNLTINTSRLRLKDGGVVNSSCLSIGNAGNVTINTAESIEVTGVASNSQPSFISSSITIASETIRNIFGLPSVLNGLAGNITIKTKLLNLSKKGIVNAGNEGTGDGGVIQIEANSIHLDEGRITAATASGDSGRIILKVENLDLIDNSCIATDVAAGSGNSGSIDIDAHTLNIQNNSKINADASQGRGGNINIAAQSILRSADSCISASSQSGIHGKVEIDT